MSRVINPVPWLSQTTNEEKKVRSTRNSKVTIPVLREGVKLIKDPFWQTILTQASTGRFPRGLSVRNGIVTYGTGSRARRFEIPDDPLTAAEELVEFIRSTVGIRSQDDQIREQAENTERQNAVKPLDQCKWSEIVRKKMQKQLIQQFVDDKADEYKLNNTQRDQLITIINVAFLLNNINGTSIVLGEGKIVDIKGLSYDDEKKKFVVTRTSKSTKGRYSKVELLSDEDLLSINNKLLKATPVKLSAYWSKYIQSLTKRSNGTTTTAVNTPRSSVATPQTSKSERSDSPEESSEC